jgi:hypothetical protein
MPGGCVVSVLIRIRGKLRSLIGRSDLDVVIPPEVVDDPFAAAITEYASRPEVITAIEIGSSSGAGSTKALFEGMTGRTGVQLYCLELSEPRFAELVARYQDHPWVHCLNATSVPIEAFPSDQEVKRVRRAPRREFTLRTARHRGAPLAAVRIATTSRRTSRSANRDRPGTRKLRESTCSISR